MEIPIPEVVFTWQFWLAAVICYVICEAVKRIPNIPSWFINVANIVVGALVYTALVGGWIDASAYLFGILASSVADLAYQVYKNIFESITGKDHQDKIGGTE